MMHSLGRLCSSLRAYTPHRENFALVREIKYTLNLSKGKIWSHADGTLAIEPSVRRAMEDGRPVVALESTIISHGMPYPENLAMARNVEDIIRSRGAIPATVAILAGRPHVGLTPGQLEGLAKAGPRAKKCSKRDLAVVMAQGVDGATTVASTAYLASLAGISVFVTGGMGGVHRGAETTFDVSADLAELAQTPVVVVCAGVKSILDIKKTLEVLETNGVPVVAYGTDMFPAFFSPSSGVRAPLRMDTPSEVAAAARAGFELGMRNGMVVAVPNPSPMEEGAEVDAAICLALEEAERRGLTGRDVTPFLLARVNETTGGKSLKSNVALVRHNAKVGADIAVELAAFPGKNSNPSPSPCNLSSPFSRRTPPPTSMGETKRRQPRTRVAVFGGAVVDTVSRPELGCALTPGTSTPGETQRSFGGVGRNVAEGLARLLLLSSSARPDGSDKAAEITLVAAVGADDAGRALVNACEEAGVCARDTVEVGSEGDRHPLAETEAGTASYVAVLGGDGDLVAAVADMRVMERMTPDFVDRHSDVIDRAGIVVADGNLPPAGFERVARLCIEKRVPLVFEPTSVAKCSVPFKAEAAGCIALTTPNLDELMAMALATGDDASGPNSGAETGPKKSHEVNPPNFLDEGGEGSGMRAGHSLHETAIKNGRLVDPLPFGLPLKAVLTVMLGAGEQCISEEHMTGCATMQPLLDGGRHVVVTMGSAGVLLATARLASSSPRNETAAVREGNAFLETPPGSGRLFSLSARHYPALPLEGLGRERIVANCTGAGDCLVAGMVGGFALGWGIHESLCLGLLCARQSVMAEQTVPDSLSELLPIGYAGEGDGSCGKTSGWSALGLLEQLPKSYEPTVVNPWLA